MNNKDNGKLKAEATTQSVKTVEDLIRSKNPNYLFALKVIEQYKKVMDKLS